MIQTLKDNLRKEIKEAVLKCGYIQQEADFNIILENSKDVNHGDYSTNVAMQLTKLARKNPRMIAEELLNNFNGENANVEKVEIAGPGFINFFMNKNAFTKSIKNIIESGTDFGKSDFGNLLKYNVEYVSANPTGDLHLGHARGAALGDSLCRILSKAGYDVTREYYVNDAGNQIHNLVISAYARYLQALGKDAEMPEDGYHGPDIISLGKMMAEKYQDQFVDKLDENYDLIRQISLDYELNKIKKDLEMFGVEFDLFTSEKAIYDKNLVKESIDLLQEKGYIYEQDGAVWFRSTDFGDDKDRVLRKSDGSYTYLTPDIANHIEKLNRGNDKLVDIWGADHHGYIARVTQQITEQTQQITEQTLKIQQLTEQVEFLTKKLFGSSSEKTKVDPNQLSNF